MPEYKKIRLADLFENIVQGRRLKKEDHIPGKFPFIMSGVTNTGLVSYIANPINRFPANSLTIDIFGNTFYRGYEFSASDDVGVYWSNKDLSRETLLYIGATIQKLLDGKFNYGNKLRASQSYDYEISLPITRDGELDFAYMDARIHELEATRIHELETAHARELDAYLRVTGLTDYRLTMEEDKIMKIHNNKGKRYNTFKLGNLFEWQPQREIRPLDIHKYEIANGQYYPYYGQSTINNGIISYLSLSHDVLNNRQGKPTILIHSNNQNIAFLESPFYLKDGHGATSVLQADFLNRETALFIISCIKRVIVNTFSYNEKATKIALKNTEIQLPIVDNSGLPDYDYMISFIRIQQKLAIKNIVAIRERELEVYRNITAS